MMHTGDPEPLSRTRGDQVFRREQAPHEAARAGKLEAPIARTAAAAITTSAVCRPRKRLQSVDESEPRRPFVRTVRLSWTLMSDSLVAATR
jgi:hypothetical protein